MEVSIDLYRDLHGLEDNNTLPFLDKLGYFSHSELVVSLMGFRLRQFFVVKSIEFTGEVSLRLNK